MESEILLCLRKVRKWLEGLGKHSDVHCEKYEGYKDLLREPEVQLRTGSYTCKGPSPESLADIV